MTRTLCAALLAAACFTARAEAQQPAQRQLDSLAVEVRALRVRLDSLRTALARMPRRPADTARAPVDEDVASLRAAAAQMVGRDTTQTADTVSARRFVGRERNQAQLNPEISATGDVRAYATTSGVQRENFDPHEFEVGFQSALDPYSHTRSSWRSTTAGSKSRKDTRIGSGSRAICVSTSGNIGSNSAS